MSAGAQRHYRGASAPGPAAVEPAEHPSVDQDATLRTTPPSLAVAYSEKLSQHGLEGEEAPAVAQTLCCRMLLQNVFAGGIIGRGGREINALRSQSQASIDIKKGRRGDCWRLIVINGSMQNVILGVALICQRVAALDSSTGPPFESTQIRDSQLVAQILVPQRLAGLIIGRAGATIKSLNAQTGCHIKIVGQFLDCSDERPLEIRGSREALEMALQRIFAFWVRYPKFATTLHPFDPDRVGPSVPQQLWGHHVPPRQHAHHPHAHTHTPAGPQQFVPVNFHQYPFQSSQFQGALAPRHLHHQPAAGSGPGMAPRTQPPPPRLVPSPHSAWVPALQAQAHSYNYVMLGVPPPLGAASLSKRVAGPGPPSAQESPAQQTEALLAALTSIQKGPHFFTAHGQPESNVEITIPVPHHLIGAVLGRRGRNVAVIRADSQAYVKIDDEVPHTSFREVHIAGSGECVARAVDLVRTTIVTEGSRSGAPTTAGNTAGQRAKASIVPLESRR